MKRRWRVVLLRAKGEILGTVEAPDVEAAKAAAAVQFDLDEVRSGQGWEERWAGDAMARAGALAADDGVGATAGLHPHEPGGAGR